MQNDRLSAALAQIARSRGCQYALLAAITLLAAALRLYKLGEWSFWIDEIFTINRAQAHFSDLLAALRNLPNLVWLPPSVVGTAGAIKLFGLSEWSARLASAVIGVVSLPLLFIPVKKTLGSGVALAMVLLLAVSPWHLFWSQNARFYTSLALIYTLALFIFFFGLERKRPAYLILFFVLCYFAMSERHVAVMIVPVVLGYLVALWVLRFPKPAGLSTRTLLLFSSPVALVLLMEAHSIVVTGSSFLASLRADLGGPSDDPPRLFAAIVFNIGLPIAALAVLSGAFLLLKRSRIGLLLLISAVLPVVIVLVLNPFVFTKDRYVFMTLPSWLILAGVGVRELVVQAKGHGKIIAVAVLVALITEAAGADVLYYRVNNGNRRDWRAGFEIMKDKSQDGDVFVAWWPEFGPYYLGREIVPWKDIHPETIVQSGKRHWFLIDSETVWGNSRMQDWVPRNCELIDVLYLRLPEDDFNLRLYLYDPDRPSGGK